MSMQLAQAATSLILRVTVILAVGLTVAAAARRLSAEFRHLTLLVTVGGAVMLPLVLAVVPRWSVRVLPSAVVPTGRPASPRPDAGAITPGTPVIERSKPSVLPPSAVNEQTATAVERGSDGRSMWLLVVPTLWALGALTMIRRIVVGHARLRRIAARSDQPDGDTWQPLLDAERAQMGIGRPVLLLVSHMTTTPLTWGMRPPVILMPHSAEEWPDARRRAVLRHELAHIARGDAEARWLTAVLCTLYWFHPLAWLAARALRVEGELACDDHVVVSGIPAEEYAGHLLEIARATRTAGPPELLAVSMASQPHIARRIFAVLDGSRRRHALAPRTRRLAVAGGTMALLAAGACQLVPRADAQSAQSAQHTIRDSSGVRIVENTRPSLNPGTEWRVLPKPLIDIGGRGGPNYEFSRIAGVVRLADGRIVAADEKTLELRVFDPAGRYVRTIRRPNNAPSGSSSGFGTLSRLPGDTLALDAMNGASLFTPAGDLVRDVRFGPFAPGALQTPFPMVLGRFDDGSTVVSDYPQGRRRPANAARWVDSASIFVLDRAGAIVRPLGTTPAALFQAGTSHPSPVTFGPELAFSSSGRSMYVAFTNQYSINVYSSDWKLQRIIRRQWTPKPITSEDLEAYFEGWGKMWIKTTGAAADKERKELREQGYAEMLPAFASLLASTSGEVWAREPSLNGAPGCWCTSGLSDAPSRWSVFGADGGWLGDVALPPRFTPKEIGADYVLGTGRDAGGKPHVLMYRLVKA